MRALLLLMLAMPVYAADRTSPNDLGGKVTLTELPCPEDMGYPAMKLATSNIFIDGVMQTVEACYFETGPDPQEVAAVSNIPDVMRIELFGMVHIVDKDGVRYDISVREFE